MKKFKLGVLAMALVSMLGFTSCLDSGEVSNVTGINSFARVTNYLGLYSFSLPTGLTLTPLNQTGLENINKYSNYTWLTATADGDTQDLENSKNWDITVLGYYSVKDGQMVAQSPVEENANAPVSDVNYSYFGNEVRIMFFNLNEMFLPVFYRIRTVDRDDDDEVNAELEAHSFTLYYNATEDFQNGAMTLHLRHYIADLQADDEFMSDPTMGIEHFDISAPLQAYASTIGGTPDRIVIAFEQNSIDGSYDSNRVSDNTFEINYQTYVDYYNQYMANNGSGSSEE
ncbi:hypothetical protein Bacsa_0018 [Phocaeicola salanitronis DSM 18170]|uniref:Lipoprotein n=1 Tax=Phocaeicola salanitronis (strain DSM 18170 / JCM 13657 / CCUG 60908 / BL78) TaxID=667015 RepID=F0R3U7_PHOSB|nr:hypothetical protein [Phocaeicola salanitronis]ADY34634.1 hypothetical protein Bacsa_0018 [Phocaeicola salanitronis DSM 18170]